MCAAGCQSLCSSVSLEGLTTSRCSPLLLHFFSVCLKISNLEGAMTGSDNVLGVWK